MKTISLIITLLISGTLFAYDFASPSEPSAKIVMNFSKPAKQLFPVHLQTINGENVNVRSGAIWLEPGVYDLIFGSQVDLSYTKRQLKKIKNDSSNQLSLKVEEGKTYFVAFDASSSETEEWGPVVYKIK